MCTTYCTHCVSPDLILTTVWKFLPVQPSQFLGLQKKLRLDRSNSPKITKAEGEASLLPDTALTVYQKAAPAPLALRRLELGPWTLQVSPPCCTFMASHLVLRQGLAWGLLSRLTRNW